MIDPDFVRRTQFVAELISATRDGKLKWAKLEAGAYHAIQNERIFILRSTRSSIDHLENSVYRVNKFNVPSNLVPALLAGRGIGLSLQILKDGYLTKYEKMPVLTTLWHTVLTCYTGGEEGFM